MPELNHSFLRALEFTGRHPNDVGEWLVTMNRVLHSEGEPSLFDPAFKVSFEQGEPFPPAPKLDPARLVGQRSLLYRRLRNSRDCIRHLEVAPWGFQSCFYLYSSWATTKNGVISMPGPDERPADITHCVAINAYLPDYRAFQFQNWWKDWGTNWHGWMPTAYFDRYSFEAWARYQDPHLVMFREAKERSYRLLRWTFIDELNQKIFGFQIVHPYKDERWAWAFVVETEFGLEIEELFVHPNFRRQGFGSILAGQISGLRAGKRKPLLVWVPFADTEQESPSTYAASCSIYKKLGIRFFKSPEKSVAYFGAYEREEGSEWPVEPDLIPARPKSALEKVKASIAAAAIALGATDLLSTEPAPATAIVSRVSYFETDEWKQMNARRSQLIHLKNRGGLDDGQLAEFNDLQRRSMAQLLEAFPPPPVDMEELDRIEERLRNSEGGF